MLTWTAIWRGMSREERADAVVALLEGAAAGRAVGSIEPLLLHVADTRKFRVATVARTPPDKIAGWVAAGKDPPARVITPLLVAWHLRHRVALLSAFLDRLKIRHENGRIAEEKDVAPPTEDALVDALRHLAGRAPEKDVSRYLDCLELMGGADIWAGLAAARKRARGQSGAPAGSPAEAEGPSADAEPGDDARTPGFSTLDQVLIDAAVGAAQGSAGALLPEQVDDLIDEVISLSHKRHGSYFHRGFFEALFTDRQPDLRHAEMNDDRRAWHLCGFVVGCARRQKWDDLVRALRDNQDTVKDLGTGRSEASALAAPIIFARAVKADGLPIAVRHTGPEAIFAAGPKFARAILDEAIARLRVGDVEQAAPAFELLDRAIQGDRDEVIAFETKREHKRRMGQLQRRRGDFRRAAAIFEELLASDPPEWMRRRTLADLGLTLCRCRSLADVRVPPDQAGRGRVVKDLQPGEARFREASGAPGRTGGHGDYVLGALMLARGSYADARPLFERAVAEMVPEPSVYDVGGVLPRARLYLAVTILSSSPSTVEVEGSEGHLRVAMDAIPEELRAYLRDLLFALAVVDSGRAAAFAADAFAKLGEAVLSAARDADLLPKLPPLRDALLDRARAEGRPPAQRFEDARLALVASRDANDVDRARDAFDVLEDLAWNTAAERRRFLDLTADLEEWGAVWAPHEARLAQVPLLVKDDRHPDAAEALFDVARDLAARRDEGSIELGRDALAWADCLGVAAPPELARALERRTSAGDSGRRHHGRVLFIGGNETQARYDAELKAEVKAKWGVTLETFYSGWSSNWGREVASVENKLVNAGAVVLLHFMRTMFGRRLRELCSQHGKPWVPSTGHGYESILRAIGRAVAMLPTRG